LPSFGLFRKIWDNYLLPNLLLQEPFGDGKDQGTAPPRASSYDGELVDGAFPGAASVEAHRASRPWLDQTKGYGVEPFSVEDAAIHALDRRSGIGSKESARKRLRGRHPRPAACIGRQS